MSNSDYQPKHPIKKAWRNLRSRMRRFLMLRTTFIAVTGSCGKTSTVFFLGQILSRKKTTAVRIGRNTRKAVLRSLRKTKLNTRFLVQETAASEPGSIAELMQILRPQVGIVTTVGKDHYRVFRTLEATAREKRSAVECLPSKGVAVLNADDPNVAGMASHTRARVLTYGCSQGADVRVREISAVWPERLSLTITYRGESVKIETGLFGDLLAASVTAAAAGALAVGASLEECAEGLRGIESFPRRLSIHRNSRGQFFVNDAFKAPYWGVEASINQLRNARVPRTTIVFGSFSDTSGSGSPKYRAAARTALEIADRVVMVGDKAVHARKLCTPETEGRLFVFDSVKDAKEMLASDPVEDEVIMLKSNVREHLERLMDIESEDQKCWLNTCSSRSECRECYKRTTVAGPE